MIERKLRPFSRHQIASLREIKYFNVTVRHLRYCKDVTMWSLLKAKLAVREGKHLNDDDILVLTAAGEEVLGMYTKRGIPLRNGEQELTNRLRRYLHASRVVPIRRAS